ncbi:MAG: PQQ-binding-like beta-propeller repeat protein, partial [Verrucomicrobiae bacterium]|nr:PQQ-binding-like beta-propeller repeat protein [Verrucomicrobiae bacterium]
MRVVDYQKDTSTNLPYQLIRGVGMVAGVFSLVVCILIIANNLSVKKTDPIHSPALQRLIEELKTNPKDESLREEIRDLDMIARRAFFSAQRFNRTGIYLLVGGLVVMIVCFKTMEAYKSLPPYPDSSDPKDDLVENATWARKAVMAVGLMLVGFALMIALPWESTLDLPEGDLTQSLPPAPGEDTAPKSEPAAPEPAAPPAPAPKTAVAAAPIAIPEERLKNWPSLFGPQSRISTATGLPAAWDGASGEGIKWKTAVPLPGFSSPIFWNGKLFVTGGDENTHEVYCLDAESGAIIWQKKVENVPGAPTTPPDVSPDTGFASGTMVTDGARVFAIFANGDLAAFDLDGNPVWAKSVGTPNNPYGYASSLAIHEDIVIVQFD